MNAVEWKRVLMACGVKEYVADKWAIPFETAVRPEYFSMGKEELDDFLGQILHESAMLTKMVEAMSYSAERLMVVWPGRFPTLELAKPYERNPEKLANYVYGGRLGNTEPGDGWRFRGRTPIHLTGRANYQRVGDLIGQDLTVIPELAEQPTYSLEIARAWWEDRIPDSMIGDPEKVTRRVQGGLLGLSDREFLTGMAQTALA